MTEVLRIDLEADAFLREVRELGAAPDAAATSLLSLSDVLPVQVPPPPLRSRILEGARSEERLQRFATTTAKFLDVSLEKARVLLAQTVDASAWTVELPGVSFLWVEGGPRVANAIRGFMRVEAGCQFPDHEHLGEELVLVLQGGFEDVSRGLVFRPGDVDRMPPGTSHSFRALPDGPDLVQLAVTHTGLRALGTFFGPR
jgi:putative transcriptional regulator